MITMAPPLQQLLLVLLTASGSLLSVSQAFIMCRGDYDLAQDDTNDHFIAVSENATCHLFGVVPPSGVRKSIFVNPNATLTAHDTHLRDIQCNACHGLSVENATIDEAISMKYAGYRTNSSWLALRNVTAEAVGTVFGHQLGVSMAGVEADLIYLYTNNLTTFELGNNYEVGQGMSQNNNNVRRLSFENNNITAAQGTIRVHSTTVQSKLEVISNRGSVVLDGVTVNGTVAISGNSHPVAFGGIPSENIQGC